MESKGRERREGRRGEGGVSVRGFVSRMYITGIDGVGEQNGSGHLYSKLDIEVR